MAFFLPASVSQLISRLESAGYEAYAVGGCVRDMICGRTPHDWDLCTSAMPWETKACFLDCTMLTIGEKHGTITVLWNGEPYEITTYRVDGTYTDCRRPEEVTFVRSLEEDLRRRDFTMNAMAYHPERGLVDLCGGRDDLAAGVLRCMGDPERRFSEDALRILRGLRFAACYRLALEPETAAAAVRLAPLLGRIAVERIDTEFQKLLLADGDAAAEILRQYPTVWNTIFPEFLPMQQCLQHNPYHQYDVWEHTLHVLENAPHDIILRWAALLHDVGKPACRFTLRLERTASTTFTDTLRKALRCPVRSCGCCTLTIHASTMSVRWWHIMICRSATVHVSCAVSWQSLVRHRYAACLR